MGEHKAALIAIALVVLGLVAAGIALAGPPRQGPDGQTEMTLENQELDLVPAGQGGPAPNAGPENVAPGGGRHLPQPSAGGYGQSARWGRV